MVRSLYCGVSSPAMAPSRARLSVLRGALISWSLPRAENGASRRWRLPRVLPAGISSNRSCGGGAIVGSTSCCAYNHQSALEAAWPGESARGLSSSNGRQGVLSAVRLFTANDSPTPLVNSASAASLTRVFFRSAPSSLLGDRASLCGTASSQWRYFAGLLSAGFCAVLGVDLLRQQLQSKPSWAEGASYHSEQLLVPSLVATRLAESFLEELQATFDKSRIVSDTDERRLHGKPWNTYHRLETLPDLVVYPKTTEEVVAVVKLCDKYKVPITAYGAATSLEGHTLTPYGGVSLDMNLMKGVKALHLDDMDVVVEPGIGWIELNEYLKPYGLFFPLDPGPGATIGGMCATRCSGSLAVRYGTIRDNVISLKVVMANGDVVKTAARARKSAAGYDLTRLLIGSEGTLGVITEVTLRLQKIPEASTVAMCNFPSIGDAADVAIGIMHSGIQASRIELLDDVMMKGVNLANGTNYPEEPTLMFELIGTEAYALEQTQLVQKIAEQHQASDFVYAVTPEEKVELWKIRKEAFWSTAMLRENAEAMVTDVCVPLSKLAECISAAKFQLDASPLTTCILCHAGDGNFHAIILFDPENNEEVDEAQRLSKSMIHTALSLEGTCTGEHGVGVGKMQFLEEELGQEALKAMGSIKQALDPGNIMNPGKIIPPQFCY